MFWVQSELVWEGIVSALSFHRAIEYFFKQWLDEYFDIPDENKRLHDVFLELCDVLKCIRMFRYKYSVE